MKRALKNWVLQPVSVGEAGHFRCHIRLASVVAQFQVTDPAQLLHCVDLSGGRVEGVTLGAFFGDKIAVPHPACLGRCTLLKWRLRRHLPPWPNRWRRSCQCPPMAPPAPAVSVSAVGISLEEVLTRKTKNTPVKSRVWVEKHIFWWFLSPQGR